MIIAVDFDGTLHDGVWPSIGAPAPDATEIMRQLKADGHYLIIWTCRVGDRQTEMVNWLLEKGIPFDRINDNCLDVIKKYGSNPRKVYAHFYIEDRQVGGLPAWNEIYDEACLMEANYKTGLTQKSLNKTGIKIGSRFRDRENGDKATVTNIFTAYPDGVATLYMEVKFDADEDTCVLCFDRFEDYYELIK
jgi:hypothetical protein